MPSPKMELQMEKLDRIHYLKHYQGCKALVMDPGNFKSGIIETVDLEGEGSVLMKQGEVSNWVEASHVNPGLKQWKDLDTDDLNTILDNIIINGTHVNHSQFHFIARGNAIEMGFNIVPRADFKGEEDHMHFTITDKWNMYFKSPGGEQQMLDNMPAIIFLLCELGYDVCGVFGEQ